MNRKRRAFSGLWADSVTRLCLRASAVAPVFLVALLVLACRPEARTGVAAERAETGPPKSAVTSDVVTLRGRVVDSSGQGIPGITIVVEQDRPGGVKPGQLPERDEWRNKSDGDGNWHATGPAVGRQVIITTRGGREWVARPRGTHEQKPVPNEIGVLTPAEALVTGLDFVLYKRATTAGVVRGPNGSPLAGAIVVPLGIPINWESDDQGRFQVDDFIPGTAVTLVVKHPDGATRICEPVTTSEGETRTLEVRLSRGGTVRGRVTPRAGKVLFTDTDKPRLRFFPAGQTDPGLLLCVTRFKEPGRVPGGPCARIYDVLPAPRETGDFLVEHLPEGKVDLHLLAWRDFTPEGEEPSFVASRLYRETPPELLDKMREADRKAFPVIKYPVLFFGTISGIEVREGEATDVGEIHYEQPGCLTGHVLGADAKPVSGASVYVTLTELERVGMIDKQMQRLSLDTVMTRADDSGRYAFEHLCRGPRKLWVGRFDAPDSEKIDVDMAGREEVEVDLRLPR